MSTGTTDAAVAARSKSTSRPKRPKSRAHVVGCGCLSCRAERGSNGHIQASTGWCAKRDDGGTVSRARPAAVDDQGLVIVTYAHRVASEDRRVWAWWTAVHDFRWYCNNHSYPIIDQVTRYLAWHELLSVITPKAAYLLMLWEIVVAAAMQQHPHLYDFGQGGKTAVDPLASPMAPAMDYMRTTGQRVQYQTKLATEDDAALRRQIERYQAQVPQ